MLKILTAMGSVKAELLNGALLEREAPPRPARVAAGVRCAPHGGA